MAGPTKAKWSPRAIAGVALLGTGSLLMAARLGLVALQVPRLMASLGFSALDACMAMALTALRLLRAVVFDPAAMLSFASALLVLFLALVAIVAGLLLLRKRGVEPA
jgi:hypothetical protein